MLFIVFSAVAALTVFSGPTEARAVRTKRHHNDVWTPSDPQAFELKLGYDQVGRFVTTIGMVSRQWAGLRKSLNRSRSSLLNN
jgi:hypothetical protein